MKFKPRPNKRFSLANIIIKLKQYERITAHILNESNSPCFLSNNKLNAIKIVVRKKTSPSLCYSRKMGTEKKKHMGI
jgi:hypothetical protein